MPAIVTINPQIFEGKACAMCGSRAFGISADDVGVRDYTISIALCGNCHKRVQLAMKAMSGSSYLAKSTLPTMASSRLNDEGEKGRHAIYARNKVSDLARPKPRALNRAELLTEAIIASVANGSRTVEQLKSNLKDGLAFVEDRGVGNVTKELLLASLKIAL